VFFYFNFYDLKAYKFKHNYTQEKPRFLCFQFKLCLLSQKYFFLNYLDLQYHLLLYLVKFIFHFCLYSRFRSHYLLWKNNYYFDYYSYKTQFWNYIDLDFGINLNVIFSLVKEKVKKSYSLI
jgi:hypothetical protein